MKKHIWKTNIVLDGSRRNQGASYLRVRRLLDEVFVDEAHMLNSPTPGVRKLLKTLQDFATRKP